MTILIEGALHFAHRCDLLTWRIILISVYTQATRALESVALAILFVTTVCLVFYVGATRSRTRGMAIAIMVIAFLAGMSVILRILTKGEWIHLATCPAEPGYTLPLQTGDPDQFASKEANWSASALFINLWQQSCLNNLIWLAIRNGRSILIYSAWQGIRTETSI